MTGFPSDDPDRDDLEDPELRYVAVTMEQLTRSQAEIGSCESCDPKAEIPFDWLLRDVSSEKGCVDYILPRPAYCPRCHAGVHEKTLVERVGGMGDEVAAGR